MLKLPSGMTLKRTGIFYFAPLWYFKGLISHYIILNMRQKSEGLMYKSFPNESFDLYPVLNDELSVLTSDSLVVYRILLSCCATLLWVC